MMLSMAHMNVQHAVGSSLAESAYLLFNELTDDAKTWLIGLSLQLGMSRQGWFLENKKQQIDVAAQDRTGDL